MACASGMRPAARQRYGRRLPSRLCQGIVAGVGIGLHDATPAIKVSGRMLAPAIAGVAEPGSRRRQAAKGAVIAHIGP